MEITNPNYGKIILILGDYSVDDFGKPRSVNGRLAFVENPGVFFGPNPSTGKYDLESFTFRHYEQGETCTIAGQCLARDTQIIDETNIEASLTNAWINGLHKKTIIQRLTYRFKDKPQVPLTRLRNEFRIIKRVRDSSLKPFPTAK